MDNIKKPYYGNERLMIKAYLEGSMYDPANDINAPGEAVKYKLIRDPDDYECETLNLEFAVAGILLKDIEKVLPVFALMNTKTGDLTFSRDLKDHHPKNTGVLLPIFLFGINWAYTAPGISWPEYYYMTYVPEFEEYIITASSDSTDAWGAIDIAIGHFSKGKDIRKSIKKIITGFWYGWNGTIMEKGKDYIEFMRWEYFERDGLISEEEAIAWRDEMVRDKWKE